MRRDAGYVVTASPGNIMVVNDESSRRMSGKVTDLSLAYSKTSLYVTGPWFDLYVTF